MPTEAGWTAVMAVMVGLTLAISACVGPIGCQPDTWFTTWTEPGLYERVPRTNLPPDYRNTGEQGECCGPVEIKRNLDISTQISFSVEASDFTHFAFGKSTKAPSPTDERLRELLFQTFHDLSLGDPSVANPDFIISRGC